MTVNAVIMKENKEVTSDLSFGKNQVATTFPYTLRMNGLPIPQIILPAMTR